MRCELLGRLWEWDPQNRDPRRKSPVLSDDATTGLYGLMVCTPIVGFPHFSIHHVVQVAYYRTHGILEYSAPQLTCPFVCIASPRRGLARARNQVPRHRRARCCAQRRGKQPPPPESDGLIDRRELRIRSSRVRRGRQGRQGRQRRFVRETRARRRRGKRRRRRRRSGSLERLGRLG